MTEHPQTVEGRPLSEVSTSDLVAELARRNRPQDDESVDRLLAGLSDAEILDFVDWGAVTAVQARAFMRRQEATR